MQLQVVRGAAAVAYAAAAVVYRAAGASVGSGNNLTVKVELADTLIDAGYQIRIDSAVESQRENRAEVIVPLTQQGSGKPTSGSGYVDTFTYDL